MKERSAMSQSDIADLLNDLEEVFERYNIAIDGTAIVENTYLQTIMYI